MCLPESIRPRVEETPTGHSRARLDCDLRLTWHGDTPGHDDDERKLSKALGREELRAILDTEGQATVNCQYCHQEYVFEREELEGLLAAL